MSRTTGGKAVIEQLEREDVDTIFGIPGVHTLEMYDALVDSEIRPVTTRHEQGAGFMADGYARATGNVGVALLITGPGLTNAATPIAQAYSDSSPMLIISSQNKANEIGHARGKLHELKDQKGMMDNIVAYSERVERVNDIPDAISSAFQHLDAHRPRPVHLEIPIDILSRKKAVEPVDRESHVPERPDEVRLRETVDRMEKADKPLLIAGGGTTSAATAVRRFVERTEIPVITTIAGKGVVPKDSPYNIGYRFRQQEVSQFIATRDLVLAVGTELSPMDTKEVEFPENLVHIDIDYRNFGKNYPTAVKLTADASVALEELLALVEERNVTFGTHNRERVADINAHLAQNEPDGSGDQTKLRIINTLRSALDDDAIVANDMTKVCYKAAREFPTNHPGTFIFPRGYGTLGFSPPTSFGAAIGCDDRQVVSIVGDGGFMFTVPELSTAVEYDLNVPIVLINDGGYGVIEDTQVRDYGRSVGTDVENPDFIQLAKSTGSATQRVDVDHVESELPAAISDAFDRDRPTVIEIPVNF
ncbi:thiamine pyrophosphate-binding protein [Natrarchaeobius chitinivorans]|nr:5-guanidino-2-oxopentanoate decarboxylase [Natrarchaeobius chitinivorans]